MSEQNRDRAESAPFSWTSPLQAPPFWMAFGSCAKATEPVARNAARIQLEMSSLAGTRMKAWSGIPETLMRCRTPFDLMQAQAAFWQAAGRDYMTAGERVARAWRDARPVAGFAAARPDEKVEPRDYITFREPRPDTAGEDRRHPGETRKAA
ncbi:MAG: hypothetical protein AB7O57_17700 [Hyphomicrobiaceae bacterium]